MITMTREEEILNRAIDYSELDENFLEYDDCGDVCDDKYFIEKAFKAGAEWADKTMIDKACQWLNNEFLQNKDRDGYPNVESRSCISVEELIQDFRKAMEE